MTPTLRIARPSSDLIRVLAFYRDGLGFEVLGQFAGHEGFDGVMLGHRGAPYHLEFTLEHGHPAPRAPSPEHLLVLYFPEPEAWTAAVERMGRAGFGPVPAHNPYWDRGGKTFEDFEGYRVVLFQGAWPRAA